MLIREILDLDRERILAIYEAGIQTGIATFEKQAPNWREWNNKFLGDCRLAVEWDQKLVAWAALSAVSKRIVYRGVAEVTIYVDPFYQRRGIGKALLKELVKVSEQAGFWTLQASIFTANEASVHLHHQAGFRTVGVREQIAERDGDWKDTYLLERRSRIV